MKKSELLDSLQKEYGKWEAFLDRMDPTRMEQPGVNGTWSMKDLIAHLTGWNRWLVARLHAAQRSEPEPPPPWPAHLQTEDEINAWIYESNRGHSLHQVLDEMHRVHGQLLAEVESLPDDARIEHVEPAYLLVWVGDERFEVSEFFDHFHDDHEPDVRAWLARREEP
ncbi:MAG: ClbS/DfsB family four-helix bundle protein [Anaerolineae bacterium]